jgi:hypothetical protein
MRGEVRHVRASPGFAAPEKEGIAVSYIVDVLGFLLLVAAVVVLAWAYPKDPHARRFDNHHRA